MVIVVPLIPPVMDWNIVMERETAYLLLKICAQAELQFPIQQDAFAMFLLINAVANVLWKLLR